MGLYGQLIYGISLYGDSESNENIFFEWFPNAIKSADVNTQLERFCNLFSQLFWNTKASIDDKFDFSDISKIPIEYLPMLYSLIGVDYNYEIPENLQRMEVATKVEMYKKKGITASVKEFITRLFSNKVNVVMQDMYKNVFLANDLLSKTVDTVDTTWKNTLGTPDETLHYTFDVDNSDNQRHWNRGSLGIWIYLPDDLDADLTSILMAKVNRVITKYLPATVLPFIFLVEFAEEFYTTLSEGYTDELTDNETETASSSGEYTTEITGTTAPFMSNSLTSITNSLTDFIYNSQISYSGLNIANSIPV